MTVSIIRFQRCMAVSNSHYFSDLKATLFGISKLQMLKVDGSGYTLAGLAC